MDASVKCHLIHLTMPGPDSSLPPTARRESKLAGKALSSVVRHHDVVTAIAIAENQGTLVTGQLVLLIVLVLRCTLTASPWFSLSQAAETERSASGASSRRRTNGAFIPFTH